MNALDRELFYAINRWPEGLRSVFLFFSEGNKWWWVRILLLGLAIFLLSKPRTRAAGLAALISVPVSNLICDLLKATFQGLRPCVELPDAILYVNKLDSFGTASAHSANMAAVAMCLSLLAAPWGRLWWIVALMTGLSRIYVGVHYPSQVLFGWAVGAATGWVICRIARHLKGPADLDLPEATPDPATTGL